MGYDVDYNELDYAEANSICQRVYQDLQQVEAILQKAALHADLCEKDVNSKCMVAGIGARGYNLGLLADKLRVGYRTAWKAVLAGRELAEAIAQAKEHYKVVETRVERLMYAARFMPMLSEIIDKTHANGDRPPTEQMETMLRMMMPAGPQGWLYPTRGFDEQVDNVAENLTQYIRGLGPTRNSSIVLAGGDPVQKVQVDGKMNSYYELHQMLEDGGPEDNGKFMVVEIDPDTYAVILPGTQDGKAAPTPFDELGIVDAFALDSRNYAGPISEALEISGAGDGDEIILSGYSQGGIHAAQLMRSKLLNRKFNMSKLITLGSPIGNIELPERVRSLAVEDEKDMVPGTDGTPNHNEGKHYTTRFDGPRNRIKHLLPEESFFGAPHHIDNYGDHLRELDEDPKPEIREHLAHFYLPTTPLKTRKFKIERRAPEPSKLPKEKPDPDISKIAPPH